MPISMQCACGKTLRAPETAVGKKVRCPACQAAVLVEAPASEPPRAEAPTHEKTGTKPPETPARTKGGKTYVLVALGCLGAALMSCVVCGGVGGVLLVLSSPGGRSRAAPIELKGHDRAVLALAFSRDGSTLASGSADKTVRLWDVATGKEKKSLRHPAGPVYAVAWTGEGKLVTTSGDDRQNGELNWWDPESGVNRKKVNVRDGMVHGLAASPDGQKLAWGKGGFLEVIASGLADERPPLASYNDQVGDATAIMFSRDGKQLLFTSAWGARLWTIDPVGKPKKLAGPDDPTGVAFDQQGNCLVSSQRTVVSVIDPDTGNLIENIKGLGGPAFGVAATPDGKYIVSGVIDGVRFFDPKTHEEVGRLTVPDARKGPADSTGDAVFMANSLALSPDGSRVALGGGSHVLSGARIYSIYVWNVSAMVPRAKK
jgi:WD40 repeat protein